jgi:hypothetical protein
MASARGFRARLRYLSDAVLGGGAGRQLLFLFVLTVGIVLVFSAVAVALGLHEDEGPLDALWYYFGRVMDAGTFTGDEGGLNRVVSTVATILGVIVAGLLISSLAGNFQERLDSIKRGGAAVVEDGHFLVLGWSEKIYSVIDQISEAYLGKKIVVVVMAERDKVTMQDALQDKVTHLDRMKLVVRSGSSLSLHDLSRVAFDRARAIVVLVDEADADDHNKADGRIIKTLLALFNHPDVRDRAAELRVTAEVMLPANQEIASIASGGHAQVIKTNEIISKILLQTSRISGLSIVYDELLRFEGNEIHFKKFPQVVGRKFGEVLLDFPNGCLVGVAKEDGSGHTLNPPADHVLAADEELLILAEDAAIKYWQYDGALTPATVKIPTPAPAAKPVEHMLILGWNEKVFPIVEEYDNYVGPGSTLTLVNALDVAARTAALEDKCPPAKNVDIRHLVGEFTSRKLMEQLGPHDYPTVMVLGDHVGGGGVEEADTRAIIALLLLREFRRQHGIEKQEVCSEILNPKNRELAATTEINDIVISNEMVSMVLAQITYEPRVRPVLEDLFRSEGSEIYLKDLALYVPPGQTVTFEWLILAAKARGEVALGVQVYENDAAAHFGLVLNPPAAMRQKPITPKPGDRLVVLAEDDG